MKQEEPILVAIHCLVYNHEPYLRDCFEGFVMQKTNFRFVAIVHEDCSTDNSAAIIREYEAKYPDIFRPIYETENQWHKTDGSLGRIMNAAIDAIGAKYIAMCEGDDYWTDPYKLQKQVDYMESHFECTCCAHNSLLLNTKTRAIALFNKKILCNQDYTLETFITKDWFTPTASLLYRKEAHQCFEDLPSFMHGDYSWLINIILKPSTFLHYDNAIMSVYRDGGYASTHFKEIDLYNDFIALLKYYKEKSNHRCDAIFDRLIERQEIGRNQVYIYQQDCKKSRSIFVRMNHWLSRVFANIANRYVPCIQVTKRVERPQLPNIEE